MPHPAWLNAHEALTNVTEIDFWGFGGGGSIAADLPSQPRRPAIRKRQPHLIAKRLV